ncbi:MAG: NAD(P)-dependent alcohol dehydrogenase [Verrucomicrobiota bacterium]|jgi:NADPH:quinone reductase-like Zn-dependent oxidoreductase
MKAFQLHGQAGPDSLQIVDLPDPKPGPGQVLVHVRANALNYRDLMISDGRYGKINVPLVPLSDGAGEIAAVGAGVSRWKTGDRVAGAFFQNWSSGTFFREIMVSALGGALSGMLAEFVVLSEDGVVAVPPHLSLAEAATLPCAGVTAWHALVERGRLAAGQTVLLLGTGGVSIFGLQIAKMHGARTIITSSSDEKLARAKALGADHTINYRTIPEWETQVFRLTNKAGVDHVLEVGGTATFPKSLRSLGANGQVHVVGGVSGFTCDVPLREMLGKLATVNGVFVGSRAMFEALNRALDLNQVKPVIDRVFPFADAAAAYRHLQGGSHFGKVVITSSE